MKAKKIVFKSRILSLGLALTMVFTLQLPSLTFTASAESSYMLTPNDSSVIDTAATDKSVFYDVSTYLFYRLPVNLKITYLRTSFQSGCSATANKAGYIYIVTPASGSFSQVTALQQDGYTELTFNFAPDFYKLSGVADNVQLRIFKKYVMTGAKIEFSKWVIPFFSETDVNFTDVLYPQSGFSSGKIGQGTKIWSDQNDTFKNYPSCLEGISFIISPKTVTKATATALKQGYVYVITPASGQTGSLASTLTAATFEKINISSFELYNGITVPVEIYGKVCLPGDTYSYTTGWGIIAFSADQLKFTSNTDQNDKLAVLEPSSAAGVGVAKLGETVFTDRTFVFNLVPDFLQGKHFIRGSIDGGYTVTVKKAGYVYAFTPNIGQGSTQAQNLMNAGFSKLDYVYTVRMYLQQSEKTGVYRKYCSVGETLSFGKFIIFFCDNETGIDNLATVQGSGLNQVMELKPEARIMRDRHYFVYQSLPNAFNGKSFLMGSADGGTATVKTSGNILVLTPDASTTNSQEAALLAAGFAKLTFPSFALANGLAENATVFTKYVNAGETITYGKWAVLVGASLPKSEYYVFPSDTAPQIIKNPGDDYAEDGSIRGSFQGCPSIESTPGGRLWATWFTGGTQEPDEGNYGTVSYSDDGGKTWVDHAIAVRHSNEFVRVEDTQFWTDPEGRLWLFWCQSYCIQDAASLGIWTNFDMSLGVWAVRIDNPNAPIDELTWSQPIKIGNGLMRNKLTVLNQGQGNEEWLLSAYDCIDSNYSNVYSSVNKGESWQLKSKAYSKSDNIFDEHQIVERADGSLWMYLRTKIGGLGVISESFSYDRGKSWSAARNTGIGSANSRFYFGRLASGNLLLVRHNSTNLRNNLTAYLSTNGGLSWDYSLVIDERNDVSYPDVEEMPDGTIYVIYDRGRTTTREILWAGFTEQDIINGAYSSNGSFNKTIISKMYNYPVLNQNGYIYTGSDIKVSVTLQDGSFVRTNGNGIASENYSFADGVLTVSKDYINTLPEGESSFDLVTNIKTLTFRIIKLPVDQNNFNTGFDEGSLSGFTETADVTAAGQVFGLTTDANKTVVKAGAQGTGWPIHSLYLNNELYENITIESTFKRDTTVTGFPLIFLRRSNNAVNHEKAGGGVAVGIQGSGKLTVYSNSSAPVIEHEIKSGLYTDGAYNTLKVVAEGNKYQIYLNGTYLETFVDSKNYDKTVGYAGIAVSNSVAYFDGFKITLGSEEAVSSADSTLEYRFDSADELSAFDSYYAVNYNSTGVKGNVGDQWTYQSGGTIIRKGTFSTGSTNNIASLLLKDYLFKNYELSVDFKRGTASWAWATLISKQRNAGTGMMTSGFGLFMQREGKPTMWGESGITTGAYAPVTISGYDDTAWHNMKLKVVNRDIWIYIDGKQYIYVNTLGAYFLLSGLLGMQSVDNNCQFDNFVVTRLDDSGNPQSIAYDENKTNVLCIGDSITYGAGAGSTAATYPTQLQQLLGSNYNVVNYGISGRTVLKKGDSPIWNDIEYAYSLKQIPDIVVIMLGTNDAKAANWVYKDDYVADYTGLINSYKALSPDVKIYLMTSPTLYTSESSTLVDSVLTGEVVPLQKQIAQDTGSTIIDLNALTKNMSEHFPDGIHPDDTGYTLIAHTVYEALTAETGLLTDLSVVNGLSECALSATVSELLTHFGNKAANLRVVTATGDVISDSGVKVGTGMSVQLYINGEIKDSITVYVKGDIDGSGTITVIDLLNLKSAVIENHIDSLSASQKAAANYDASADGNGQMTIDALDVICIRNELLNR